MEEKRLEGEKKSVQSLKGSLLGKELSQEGHQARCAFCTLYKGDHWQRVTNALAGGCIYWQEGTPFAWYKNAYSWI